MSHTHFCLCVSNICLIILLNMTQNRKSIMLLLNFMSNKLTNIHTLKLAITHHLSIDLQLVVLVLFVVVSAFLSGPLLLSSFLPPSLSA